MNSRMGNEMIMGLAALLNPKIKKEASVAEEVVDVAVNTEPKENTVVAEVIGDLVKIASELDDIGADDASSAVDDALRIIVRDLQQNK